MARPALAQEGGGAGEPAVPAELTAEEKQAKAIELFKAGQADLDGENFEDAISKFQQAFELFPDPGLQVKIGEAYQRDGTASLDYDKLRNAVAAYKKYVELVPEGETTDAVNGRIAQLEESIAAEDQRIKRVADEETQAKLDAELAQKEKEKKEREALLAHKQMQVVLTGGVLAGADQQISGILRMSGGALLSWEHFALEGRVGIDGFLRVDADQGTQARSFTLIDVGARWGANYGYVGPFVSGGGSFGVFTGKPRERKLTQDADSCGGGDCAFDVDQNIVGRLAFGYGFKASGKSTVALRIEAQTWWLSVDPEQGIGKPPAADIAKPQLSTALMVGLEFMRWM